MEGDEFSFDNDYNLQVKDFQHYIFSLFKKLLIFFVSWTVFMYLVLNALDRQQKA